jgi:hypothetical protein
MPERVSRAGVISLLAGVPVAIALASSRALATDDSGGTKAKY